jgi:hypothetical protein
MRTKLSVRGDRYEVLSLRRPLSTSDKNRLFNAHVADSLPFGKLRASAHRPRYVSPNTFGRPLFSIIAALLLAGMVAEPAGAQSSIGTTNGIAGSTISGGVSIGGDLGGTPYSPQVVSSHLSSPLSVAQGGTAAGSAGATAAHNIGAAAEGANSDITSLTGLTTPLSVGQGGTGATSAGVMAAGNIGALAVSNNLSDLPNASTARTNLGLSSAATVSTPISVTNGGTGASSAGATAAHNIGAAAEGANSDITSLTGLTTPLSAVQGGTACHRPAPCITRGSPPLQSSVRPAPSLIARPVSRARLRPAAARLRAK